MLLAVDSGGNTGWALFDPSSKVLVACGLNKFPDRWEVPITRVVIERPHTGQTQARKRDIITLAIRAGEVGGVMRLLTGVEPEYIEPQKWKGQLPKKRCNDIVEARLSEPEKRLLNNIKPKGAKHNVLDAIGIGLFASGRGIF